jgi:hypothetical protein
LTAWPCVLRAAGDIEATLDRTRIAAGDTVILSLSVPGDLRDEPDLSPLSADFDVTSQASNTQMTIINGEVSSTRVWQFVLAPRREGKIRIPPLEVGDLRSDPLALEVLPVSQALQSGEHPAVLLEVEATPANPYVQSEIRYTVRVLARVPMRDANLTAPNAGDAIVQQLGEDRMATAYRNGERYNVIERRFVIFPQHSGALAINSPVLSAVVPAENSRRRGIMDRFLDRDPFGGLSGFSDLFTEMRRVQVRGDDINLAVRPQPGGQRATWLPAKALTLAESWSPDPPHFRVGEPVTRDITIIARGLTAAQLPDLGVPEHASIKTYPDAPKAETRTEGDDLVATKQFKIAIVPLKPGVLSLPEIRVPWWDVERAQAEVATLPAMTVDVAPAAPARTQPSAPLADVDQAPAGQARDDAKAPAPSPLPPAENLPGPNNYWPWIALAFASAWLATLALAWVRRKRSGSGPAPHEGLSEAAEFRVARRACEQACRANDPTAAREALLRWATLAWPNHPPLGLAELASRVDSAAAREALRALDRYLYADTRERSWDGGSVWNVLDPIVKPSRKPHARASGSSALPPLYPEHIEKARG